MPPLICLNWSKPTYWAAKKVLAVFVAYIANDVF